MAGWIGTDQLNYFFLRYSCCMQPCNVMESNNIFPIDEKRHVAAAGRINCTFSFKNSKLIIPQTSHHMHNITFLPWSSAFWDQRWKFIFVNPLHFVLNFVLYNPFFITLEPIHTTCRLSPSFSKCCHME